MKRLILILMALINTYALADNFKYVSLGYTDSDWASLDPHLREIQTTQATYQSVAFSMNFSKEISFGGFINIDKETNKIKDTMAQFGMDGYIFRVEYGDIKGRIKYDDNSSEDALVDKDKSFSGKYKLLQILKNKTVDGVFTFGLGVANYEMPTTIERSYAAGEYIYDKEEFIQVDNMNYLLAGIGVFKETMIFSHRKLQENQLIKKFDWFFDTSLIFGLAYASHDKIDKSETRTNRDLDENSWWGVGSSATYEVGVRYIDKFNYASVGLKLSYLARTHIYFFSDWLSEAADQPDGETVLSDQMHIVHGPNIEFSASF